MSLHACFGPNDGYLFHSPYHTTYNNLPNGIATLFQAGVVTEVLCCALGPDGSWFFVWKRPNGTLGCLYDGVPTSLKSWLEPIPGNGVGRDLASINVSLGPNSSYFCWDDRGSAWANLPVEMNTAIAGKLDARGAFKPGQGPKSVELGPDGSFVYLKAPSGGFWSSNLQNQNPALVQILRTTNLANQYIAMSNVQPGIHILVSTDGNMAGLLPPAWHPAYDQMAADWQQMCAGAKSQQRKVKTRNTLRLVNSGLRFLNAVVGGAAGSAAGTTYVSVVDGGGYDTNYSAPAAAPIPDTSAFWTPLQSAASDPIQ